MNAGIDLDYAYRSLYPLLFKCVSPPTHRWWATSYFL
nr:MAG TPA: Trp-operon Leader Peptide [Caudoviricetes sp.]DAN63155.1 MAG TPA: Trp-operon Leader Peptide [Caudoviricetes sp.]DAO22617.1 MAG TPA: Trp-operon Leader Peptide [Caudoviricetes sp.]DAO64206.1 MAG TPA: Trp-operon Leader Peptide [Bacteriophage sp.]